MYRISSIRCHSCNFFLLLVEVHLLFEGGYYLGWILFQGGIYFVGKPVDSNNSWTKYMQVIQLKIYTAHSRCSENTHVQLTHDAANFTSLCLLQLGCFQCTNMKGNGLGILLHAVTSGAPVIDRRYTHNGDSTCLTTTKLLCWSLPTMSCIGVL